MNIYINVEISARELDSKLLLATLAAAKGHHVIVSEKEIKSFNGWEACVGFSFLVAPEDCLLCLYLYGFQLLDGVLSKVISSLAPSWVYENNLFDFLQLFLCHSRNLWSLISWEHKHDGSIFISICLGLLLWHLYRMEYLNIIRSYYPTGNDGRFAPLLFWMPHYCHINW